MGQLRTVATKQGWTVIKAFVDRPGAGRAQWAALSRALAAREADPLMCRGRALVPHFVITPSEFCFNVG